MKRERAVAGTLGGSIKGVCEDEGSRLLRDRRSRGLPLRGRARPGPGPDEVLVRVEAISIEGGDTLNRLGGRDHRVPHIVGYQCAGTVVAVGDGVDRSRPGRPGGDRRARRLPRRAAGRGRAVLLGDPRRSVHRGGGLRAGPVRHGRRLPVRVRPAAAGRDRPHPRRGQRRGHRCHPAGQAGRGPGAGHRLAATRSSTGWSTLGLDDGINYAADRLRRGGPSAHRRAGRRRHRRLGRRLRPSRGASAAWPTGAGA